MDLGAVGKPLNSDTPALTPLCVPPKPRGPPAPFLSWDLSFPCPLPSQSL